MRAVVGAWLMASGYMRRAGARTGVMPPGRGQADIVINIIIISVKIRTGVMPRPVSEVSSDGIRAHAPRRGSGLVAAVRTCRCRGLGHSAVMLAAGKDRRDTSTDTGLVADVNHSMIPW